MEPSEIKFWRAPCLYFFSNKKKIYTNLKKVIPAYFCDINKFYKFSNFDKIKHLHYGNKSTSYAHAQNRFDLYFSKV